MKQRTFQAMGTDWTVLAEGCDSEAMIAAVRKDESDHVHPARGGMGK